MKKTLFYDNVTGKFFMEDPYRVKEKIAYMNSMIDTVGKVTLNVYLELLGLPRIDLRYGTFGIFSKIKTRLDYREGLPCVTLFMEKGYLTSDC